MDDGNVIIVEPIGSMIGGSETDELKNAINALLEKGNRRLILDIGDVPYLNSSAIGILVVAHSTYRERHASMILCNINKNISNVFLVTKLSTKFLTKDTREDAILAVSR